jgi:dolichol-phosphate mannosyltransferase
MKNLIIIPTYNEIENIENIIRSVFNENLSVDILIVDDNSPDQTGLKVKQLQSEYSNLFLLERKGKEGLGKAYLAGFQWGIDQKYEFLVEMDADFSHRPCDLKKIIEGSLTSDFVIGSRYVKDGSTVNWGIGRKIISKGGSLYSQWILGFPLNDWTGGFNGWKIPVLLSIGLGRVESNGYSFQIELKYKALKKGFKGLEVPIVFEDRRVGQSKMSLKIVLEAFYRVWIMRFKN